VVRKEDRLYGYNTDYFGFVYMLEKAGVSPLGKKCLVLGSGGASKTVVAALSRLGAESVSVVSRSGDVNYDNVYEKCKDAEIIVNTTPVGMFPEVNKKPLDISKFASCEFVGDVIYNPAVTRILYEAKKLGIKTANGLDMLVAQGVKASAFFTGRDEMKSELIPEICAEVKKKTVNIVLIGMPGCGKSSVGRLLAEKLGREFVDIDKEIEKRQNCTVPEIFARGGEDEFRRIETEVTEDVCKRSGLVIATGGGVVTRPVNHFSLKCNGFTVYVKRDIESLATDGRPLSAAKGREKLFSERKHLYEGWGDITADNNGGIESCVSSITSSFDEFLATDN
jgi:shikimate dehydrogenase